MKTVRRRRVKRLVSKSRPVRCFFGDALNTKYNASSGMTYSGPNYPEYTKRLDENWCLSLYRAARSSPYATSVCGYQDVLGWEEIVGTVGSRTDWNNCTHMKFGTTNLPFLWMSNMALSSRWYYTDYFRCTTNRGFAKDLATKATAISRRFEVGNDKSFSSRAFWSMRPKFEGQVSLINSIFELKDFKDVLNISKVASNFRHVASSQLFSQYRREFHKLARENNIRATLHERGLGNYADVSPKTLGILARDVSGAAAAGVLTMNLAIKPTISDALAIMAQFATSAVEAQNAFAQYGELGTTSHFSENTTESSLVRLPSYDRIYAEGSNVSITQTATMRSKYNYVPRSANEALVRYWGLAGTAEALWNMLPLSFVLDYIFTVGKSLQYMARDENVRGLTTEYCESVKVLCTDGKHIIQDPAVHALLIDGKYKRRTSKEKAHLVSGTTCTRYSRKVMEPYKGPALPKIKLPSNSQAVNVLALARCFVN